MVDVTSYRLKRFIMLLTFRETSRKTAQREYQLHVPTTTGTTKYTIHLYKSYITFAVL